MRFDSARLTESAQLFCWHWRNQQKRGRLVSSAGARIYPESGRIITRQMEAELRCRERCPAGSAAICVIAGGHADGDHAAPGGTGTVNEPEDGCS